MSGVLGTMGCLARWGRWGRLHLGVCDRTELAEGWWAKGWGLGRQLEVMKYGSASVGERQVLDGVLR